MENKIKNNTPDQILNLKRDIKSVSESKHKKFYKNFTSSKNQDYNVSAQSRNGTESIDDFKKRLLGNTILNKFKFSIKVNSKNIPTQTDNPLLTQINTLSSNFNKSEHNFFLKTNTDNSSSFGRNIKTAGSSFSKANNLIKFKNLSLDNPNGNSNIAKRISSPLSIFSEALKSPRNEDLATQNLKTFSENQEKLKNKLFLNTQESRNQIDLNYKDFDENEINHILNYYCINSDDIGYCEDENTIESNYLFKKFNLNKDNIDFKEEEIKIKSLLKNNVKIANANESYNNTYLKFSIKTKKRVQISDSSDIYFKNPMNSLKKLNFNKKIFENVSNIRNSKQIDLYMQNYLSCNERMIKSMQMKNIKETVIEQNAKNEEIYEIPSNDNDFLNDHFDFKSPLLKQMTRDVIFSKKLEFTATYSYDSKVKPFSRAQFSCNLDGNNLIMFGGISGESLCQIWICDLKNNYLWKKIDLKDDETPNPRYGHTAVLYKKEIFIYGGILPKEYFKPKEDILIFNLETNKFYSEHSKSLYEMNYRRNHIAHAIGPAMLIHGGVLENGKISNDIAILEFFNLKWNKLEYKGKSPFLAFHCSEVVIENVKTNIKNYHIYKGPNNTENKNGYKLKHEGIFFFGGFDEENNCKNDIYILKIGRKPLEWFNPKPNGIAPPPRIFAKMNFFEELNILIVHGGRNDLLKKSVFNDFWIFDLENFKWIKANINPYTPKERSEHCSIIHKNLLLILGGTNLNKYNSMDFFIVNLDLFNNKNKERDVYKEYEQMNKNEKSKKIEENTKSSQDASKRNIIKSEESTQILKNIPLTNELEIFKIEKNPIDTDMINIKHTNISTRNQKKEKDDLISVQEVYEQI